MMGMEILQPEGVKLLWNLSWEWEMNWEEKWGGLPIKRAESWETVKEDGLI